MYDPITLGAETVAVAPQHVKAVLATLADRGEGPTSAAAGPLAALLDAMAVQAPHATVWVLPAEALWRLQHHAHAMWVYRLDDQDPKSYDHPAVAAELWIAHAVRGQAPRTADVLEAAYTAEALAHSR